MTISRRILRVKTAGSRENGDLRPALVDDLPRGINLVVHEYNEAEGWCVIEIWGSDHPILRPEERSTTGKINSVVTHESVVEELATHPLSPPKLAEITGVVGSMKVDERRKVVIKEGKEYPYIRVEKRQIHDPKGEDIIIFDEG